MKLRSENLYGWKESVSWFSARIAGIIHFATRKTCTMIQSGTAQTGGNEMSDLRREKRKVEFIESYWTGGEYGCDYMWNDNHGELVRCKDCTRRNTSSCSMYDGHINARLPDDWYCADGRKKDG